MLCVVAVCRIKEWFWVWLALFACSCWAYICKNRKHLFDSILGVRNNHLMRRSSKQQNSSANICCPGDIVGTRWLSSTHNRFFLPESEDILYDSTKKGNRLHLPVPEVIYDSTYKNLPKRLYIVLPFLLYYSLPYLQYILIYYIIYLNSIGNNVKVHYKKIWSL